MLPDLGLFMKCVRLRTLLPRGVGAHDRPVLAARPKRESTSRYATRMGAGRSIL